MVYKGFSSWTNSSVINILKYIYDVFESYNNGHVYILLCNNIDHSYYILTIIMMIKSLF